ncbi:hypothetical protein EJ02DRAFT_229811 [Clathrospora elynae]|uniref:Hypersensitive response inducing protein 1 n=1 Tax=Clathrospora elynae TaxID=706981 RepID=A0A6A5SLB3_9PLEO|nr:hypothetical protein EJ02DRAFT_229811 [Clathrospora elynae]
MRFITILPSVFTTIALAAPFTIDTRADDNCTPISYTLTDYTLVTSPDSASVNFNLKSSFADGTGVEDAVQGGASCNASGAQLPNNNVCDVADRRLLFDLRGPQDQAYYQVTHTWTCNGATWISGTPVKVDPLICSFAGSTCTCTGGPMTFAPQNVRKICNSPSC